MFPIDMELMFIPRTTQTTQIKEVKLVHWSTEMVYMKLGIIQNQFITTILM